MESAKKHITALVKNYIALHPQEFEDFKRGMTAVRAIANDEFATLKGTKYTRALYEMPETLQMMLIQGLSEEEMLWLKTGVASNHNAGGHWFAKAFKDFAIPNKI